MKNILVYFLSVFVIFLVLYIVANRYGIRREAGDCPAGVIDCDGAYRYDRLLLFPKKYVGMGGYSMPVGEGYSGDEKRQILMYSSIYWFVIANVVVSILFFITSRVKNQVPTSIS